MRGGTAGLMAILGATCGMAAAMAAEPDSWTISSPGDCVHVTVQLGGDGSAERLERRRLSYRIEQGKGESRREVIAESPLGLIREDANLAQGLRFVRCGDAQAVDEVYAMVHGKRRECRVLARRVTLAFENGQGVPLELEFHVADDGVAFRYRFPNTSPAVHRVLEEATGFRLPPASRAWMQPYQEPTKWTPAYEDHYQDGIPAGTSSPSAAGWTLPALFQIADGDCWALVAEAGLDETYCGTRFAQHAPEGLYTICFPQPGDGNGLGDVCPRSPLPWQTPWRVVIVSDRLAEIVESTLVTDVSPSCRLEQVDWIRPGRASWSWWSDHDSPRDFAQLKDFVDLAAEMGWEYSLVDANWTLMDGGNVRELARYAADKGVGLLLWYNSGGPHNSVTEKPRGCMQDREIRDFEFAMLREWGVKGVKVDFFHSDKQSMVAHYLGILEDAARHQMLVNFHGCTVPRGWSRTYPHLVSMEAVRGAECYTFARDFPERAPGHNAILPFTRNVVGPMDYTPVSLTDAGYRPLTTAAHELALPVVFESGMVHFAERVAALRSLPEAARQWLRAVPAAWDETRLIGGYPGQWAVLARRSGARWFVGGIHAGDQPRHEVIPLAFLPDGRHQLSLIADGDAGLADQRLAVDRTTEVPITFLPRGGFAMLIEPAP